MWIFNLSGVPVAFLFLYAFVGILHQQTTPQAHTSFIVISNIPVVEKNSV
ncbi:hypothetical protein SAMN05660236_0401 [Ohtaekwangia koreensis]|uniref:Uncharacterized protein n=1 Tax=Ohtaekwangia koreensis TaxID=688867 RepID=A0A1T5IU82_9BACT|nr:hypothetical protein SAMN05660236_0401 [Ohtaekwangia koreensis]